MPILNAICVFTHVNLFTTMLGRQSDIINVDKSMSNTVEVKRHPFLEDLADDVVLVSGIIPEKIKGKDAVIATIRLGGEIYASQTVTYLNRLSEDRTLMEYDAALVTGHEVHAVVVINWNSDNKVSKLNISFAPLDGALAFATRLGELIADKKQNKAD